VLVAVIVEVACPGLIASGIRVMSDVLACASAVVCVCVCVCVCTCLTACVTFSGIDDNCDGKGYTTDLSITGSTTLAGGTYEFGNFTIPSGVTVTVTGSTPLQLYVVGYANILGTLQLSGGDGAGSNCQGMCACLQCLCIVLLHASACERTCVF
jgi:hypothetical protein